MKKFSIVLSLLILILCSCNSKPTSVLPTPRPTAPFNNPEGIAGEKVQMTTEDGITLQGTLYGEGEIGVILAHMGLDNVSQESWQPFARELAGLGYSALTFDFRGRGLSQGLFISSNLKQDVDAAVSYLRDHGIKKIVCIGASMGGTACLRSVIDNHLDGLVMIASPFSIGSPTYTSPYEMDELTIPTLFITAANDPYSNEIDMKVMAAKAPDPTELVIYDGVSEHGTDLFYTEYGTDLRNRLEEYLERIQP
jgi:pimeloyl-ACP methyl ester carboxylesterase